MSENSAFWDFFWEMRLQAMEGLGKREAILAASPLIRQIAREQGRPVRILEPGIGEGQVTGTLVDSHAQICDTRVVAGIDYNAKSVARCRKDYPALKVIEGDFTDPALLAPLGPYDLVILVNALHEIFSATLSAETREVDVPYAKKRVAEGLARFAALLEPGGWVLLLDGLEPPGDPGERIQVRFANMRARDLFETFAREYQPFRIHYRPLDEPLAVELSRRDFTRYLTKSIFLGKALWKTERFESYQYFTVEEFHAAFAQANLAITRERTFIMNAEKWANTVEILTPGVAFPQEHILILARKE